MFGKRTDSALSNVRQTDSEQANWQMVSFPLPITSKEMGALHSPRPTKNCWADAGVVSSCCDGKMCRKEKLGEKLGYDDLEGRVNKRWRKDFRCDLGA